MSCSLKVWIGLGGFFSSLTRRGSRMCPSSCSHVRNELIERSRRLMPPGVRPRSRIATTAALRFAFVISAGQSRNDFRYVLTVSGPVAENMPVLDEAFGELKRSVGVVGA
jgi:hypothetical protein